MASSVLRNSQQVKQEPVKKTMDSTGNGNIMNSQVGSGSGRILNGALATDGASKKISKQGNR